VKPLLVCCLVALTSAPMLVPTSAFAQRAFSTDARSFFVSIAKERDRVAADQLKRIKSAEKEALKIGRDGENK